jgi:glycosyltransferase involved in cell wall biosynthesis
MPIELRDSLMAQITVLLPVYNGAKYLKECISSILHQDFSDFELLIGDDKSTDDSLNIIKLYDDERIRLFSDTSNNGLFGNLNRLLPHINTEFVRLLGQDDLLEKNCLASELAFFGKHPEIVMSYCKVTYIDDTGAFLADSGEDETPEVLSPNLALQYFYYFGCLPGNISAVCLRTDALRCVGQFNEAFGAPADYEMWVRICGTGPIGVIHKQLVQLRRHTGQLSRTRRSSFEAVIGGRQIRSQILQKFPLQLYRNAVRYSVFRHSVLDFHWAFRAATRGYPEDILRVAKLMGPSAFLQAAIAWLLTLDNRVYRPKPRILEDISFD